MKKFLIFAGLLLVITAVKAQKQEIKKAERAVKSGYLDDASSYLENAKRIFASADSETRAHYYVVEAELKLANKDIDMEQLESISNSINFAKKYELDNSLNIRIAAINSKLQKLSAKIAANEYKKKNYSIAANLYNVAYESTKDTVYYYKAAKSHLQAKEYEEAYNAYKKLINMGFTDSNAKYAATNIKTGKKEVFKTANLRNTAIEIGTHKKPEVIRSRSKTTVLLRALTSTSIKLNRSKEVVFVIDKEIAKDPSNKVLLNQAFHLYNQLGEKDRLNKVMDLLIKDSPNDPNLYYNLGVSCTQNNELDKAIKFYKKALDLDPGNVNANANLAAIMVDQE